MQLSLHTTHTEGRGYFRDLNSKSKFKWQFCLIDAEVHWICHPTVAPKATLLTCWVLDGNLPVCNLVSTLPTQRGGAIFGTSIPSQSSPWEVLICEGGGLSRLKSKTSTPTRTPTPTPTPNLDSSILGSNQNFPCHFKAWHHRWARVGDENLLSL